MRSRLTAAGRVLPIVAGLALVASAAFSVVEVRDARRHTTAVDAPATAPSPLTGLSAAGLQDLENQVGQATGNAPGPAGTGGDAAELSQLEQQLGISPSASPASQLEQLQAALSNINACLSGSPTATDC